jgi:hypothetical protein
MARRVRLPILAAPALAALLLPLAACEHHAGGPPPGAAVVVSGGERGGPPPHAPAHGYRRKQATPRGDLDLVFDSGLGVYVVVGLPDLYFYADHYFRWTDGSWQVSLRHDSGWTLAAASDVPPGLRGKQHGKAKKPHPGPAKRGD